VSNSRVLCYSATREQPVFNLPVKNTSGDFPDKGSSLLHPGISKEVLCGGWHAGAAAPVRNFLEIPRSSTEIPREFEISAIRSSLDPAWIHGPYFHASSILQQDNRDKTPRQERCIITKEIRGSSVPHARDCQKMVPPGTSYTAIVLCTTTRERRSPPVAPAAVWGNTSQLSCSNC